jgi:hypothetical protein
LQASGCGTETLTFECFGVRMRLDVSAAEGLEDVTDLLPPGSRPCSADALDAELTLRGANSDYALDRNGETLADGLRREIGLAVLERELRTLVALNAPAHIFVHAGVVGHQGAAIMTPGSSLAGKTSLVAALVRAGATYYSDEFAPIDASGLIYPFPKPLSLRDEHFTQVDHRVDALGGIAGEAPVPAGLVVLTSYEERAGWNPRRLSSGEAVLAVLGHTVPAQTRPDEALAAISRALDGAVVLEGTRGEADEVAQLLLNEAERTR